MFNQRFLYCIFLLLLGFVSTQEPEETAPELDPFQSGDETTPADILPLLEETTLPVVTDETSTPSLLDIFEPVEDTTTTDSPVDTTEAITDVPAPVDEWQNADDVSPAPLMPDEALVETTTEEPVVEESTPEPVAEAEGVIPLVSDEPDTSTAPDAESTTTGVAFVPLVNALVPSEGEEDADYTEPETSSEPIEAASSTTETSSEPIEDSTTETTVDSSASTSAATIILGPAVPVLGNEQVTTTVSPDEEGGFWYKWGLLIAGIILFILILIAMIYACCCMKERAQRRTQPDVEDIGPDIVPIAKPIHALSKTNQYVDEVITTSSYQYRETRKEPFTAAKREPLAPNNSFATLNTPAKGVPTTGMEARSQLTENTNRELAPRSLENENTKYPLAREVLRQGAKDEARNIVIPIGTPINDSPHGAPPDNRGSSLPSPANQPFSYITPRHLDQSYIHAGPNQQPWSRRLEVPPADNRSISSRDVISASRVNNAVVTVAAAGSAPLRGASAPRPEMDTENEQRVPPSDRPVLRGGTLERATSPTRPPSYRTTLVFTPQHNRDPNEPVEASPGNTMPYAQYVDMIKGPPSDFAQFSPSRPVARERRLPDDDEDSQV